MPRGYPHGSPAWRPGRAGGRQTPRPSPGDRERGFPDPANGLRHSAEDLGTGFRADPKQPKSSDEAAKRPGGRAQGSEMWVSRRSRVSSCRSARSGPVGKSDVGCLDPGLGGPGGRCSTDPETWREPDRGSLRRVTHWRGVHPGGRGNAGDLGLALAVRRLGRGVAPALSRASLSFAYPFAALTYLVILIFDRVALHEEITSLHWPGSC